jgi:hypothetical protein
MMPQDGSFRPEDGCRRFLRNVDNHTTTHRNPEDYKLNLHPKNISNLIQNTATTDIPKFRHNQHAKF